MLDNKLLCFVVLLDEEKCFQSCILASWECRAEASGNQNHISLRARGIKLKTLLLSWVHLALIFIREKLVRLISRNSQRRLQCPLGISHNSQCIIANIFPHALRPILMVSVNVNMERSAFMFVHDSRPYGPIFHHDIEILCRHRSWVQISGWSKKVHAENNFNYMNFGFFIQVDV